MESGENRDDSSSTIVEVKVNETADLFLANYEIHKHTKGSQNSHLQQWIDFTDGDKAQNRSSAQQ